MHIEICENINDQKIVNFLHGSRKESSSQSSAVVFEVHRALRCRMRACIFVRHISTCLMKV